MKKKHQQEINDQLQDLTQKFNKILSDNGFAHIAVNKVTFNYIPCDSHGRCPAGLEATPVYNSKTKQYDCYCLPRPNAIV